MCARGVPKVVLSDSGVVTTFANGKGKGEGGPECAGVALEVGVVGKGGEGFLLIMKF